MKRHLLLVLSGCLILSLAVHAKSKTLPAVFMNAQFVRVEAYNGDTFNPNVLPDDRRAIYDVEQRLQDRELYTLVLERKDADLVLVVRKGRVASATGRLGVDIGGSPRQRGQSQPQPDPTRDESAVGYGVGADAGPADDLLEVYILDPNGRLNGPIWTHLQRDGLDEPTLPLFQQLKHEVDTSYPK